MKNWPTRNSERNQFIYLEKILNIFTTKQNLCNLFIRVLISKTVRGIVAIQFQ